MIVLCWFIWKDRNKLIFRNAAGSTNSLFLSTMLVFFFRDAEVWKPPGLGWIKINVDVAFSRNLDRSSNRPLARLVERRIVVGQKRFRFARSGLGLLARDAAARFLVDTEVHVVETKNRKEAECWGILVSLLMGL